MILKVFQIFLSSRTQRVKVDGVCSSSIDVVSGVPQVVFLVHCCFCCTLLTFQGYFRMCWLVMLTTLPCFVIPHPRDRASVAASLNNDLAVISD